MFFRLNSTVPEHSRTSPLLVHVALLFSILTGTNLAAQVDRDLPELKLTEPFLKLALHCVHTEYPNKISHVLASDQDVRAPRELTPVFYGCFDWHSAVHGHWLLVRMLRFYPEASFAEEVRGKLRASFTPDAVAGEVAYLAGAGRVSFERPYGLAWLLQLCAELREWDDVDARLWSAALAPLERTAADRLREWLPKLSHAIRTGEHSQTAFALALVLDWARIAGDRAMENLVVERALHYHARDRSCMLQYEPGGQDFLSPCLQEADLMRRVLPSASFAAWLGVFLPEIDAFGDTAWLKPAVVTDRSDGKLVHLDGLNLARAWALDGIAEHLPAADPRRTSLLAVAEQHRIAGIKALEMQSYEGQHWLGSFATYLVTRRGHSQND